jgi:iron(III) transport system substrate-binding protein
MKVRFFHFTSLFGAVMAAILIAGLAPFVSASGKSQTGSSGSGTDKPLIVYTNSGSDGRAEWLMEEAKQAGFTIEVVNLGGGELMNRIIAEKNNPVGDCVFGLSPMYFEQLKRENALVKWEPSWSKKVDQALIDPDRFYFPHEIAHGFMMYNRDALPPGRAPADITELGKNPAFKDKCVIGGLAGGTPQTILISLLSRYRDPNGELQISAQGWNEMKSFIQSVHIEASGEDTPGNLANGTVPMVYVWGARYYQWTNDYPQTHFDAMIPPAGIPYIVAGTAIFNKSPNYDRAKAFLDWFGDVEFQEKWAVKYGTVPVFPESTKAVPQIMQDLIKKAHPQEIDWAWASTLIGAWVQKIQLEYVQ